MNVMLHPSDKFWTWSDRHAFGEWEARYHIYEFRDILTNEWFTVYRFIYN